MGTPLPLQRFKTRNPLTRKKITHVAYYRVLLFFQFLRGNFFNFKTRQCTTHRSISRFKTLKLSDHDKELPVKQRKATPLLLGKYFFYKCVQSIFKVLMTYLSETFSQLEYKYANCFDISKK